MCGENWNEKELRASFLVIGLVVGIVVGGVASYLKCEGTLLNKDYKDYVTRADLQDTRENIARIHGMINGQWSHIQTQRSQIQRERSDLENLRRKHNELAVVRTSDSITLNINTKRLNELGIFKGLIANDMRNLYIRSVQIEKLLKKGN